jgi:hypothetical protein
MEQPFENCILLECIICSFADGGIDYDPECVLLLYNFDVWRVIFAPPFPGVGRNLQVW